MPKGQIPRLNADPATYSSADFLQLQHTGEKPVNPDWLAKRSEVLADADLEDDTPEVTDLNDMTAAQHLQRLQETDMATKPQDVPDTKFTLREPVRGAGVRAMQSVETTPNRRGGRRFSCSR